MDANGLSDFANTDCGGCPRPAAAYNRRNDDPSACNDAWSVDWACCVRCGAGASCAACPPDGRGDVACVPARTPSSPVECGSQIAPLFPFMH